MQNTAKMFVQKILYIIAMNDANMHGQMLPLNHSPYDIAD